MQVDKHAVFDALCYVLRAELADTVRRAIDAAEAATHEENRAEGSKDMRATEASYVARGQSLKVHELEHTLAQLATLELRTFARGESIAASALVTLEHQGRRTVHFVVPTGGGVTLDVDGTRVSTVHIASPLGQALLGLAEGEEAEIESPTGVRIWSVVAVC
jgi:transcription elongation GreA/GreB family factor